MKGRMKLRKLKSLLLLSIALGSNISFGASEGGNASGGGNTINHQLIENYADSLDSFPGYSIALKYLSTIEAAVPDFGKKIRSHLDAATVYVVPKTIRELPFDQTGLNFPSTQAAYQVDDEIFISKEAVENMKAEDQAQLFLHEMIMLVTDKKEVSKVRKLMIFLKSRNFSPDPSALVSKVANLGFGSFLTEEKFTEVRLMTLKETKFELIKRFQKMKDYCDEVAKPLPWYAGTRDSKGDLQKLAVDIFMDGDNFYSAAKLQKKTYGHYGLEYGASGSGAISKAIYINFDQFRTKLMENAEMINLIAILAHFEPAGIYHDWVWGVDGEARDRTYIKVKEVKDTVVKNLSDEGRVQFICKNVPGALAHAKKLFPEIKENSGSAQEDHTPTAIEHDQEQARVE